MSKLGRNPFEGAPARAAAPQAGTVLNAKTRGNSKKAKAADAAGAASPKKKARPPTREEALKKAERLADEIRFKKREQARERAMKSVTPCAFTQLAAEAIAGTVVLGIKAYLVAREVIAGRA